MNYTMGRYIEKLDAEGRDRLIAAPDFIGDAEWWNGECGCLVGTVNHGSGGANVFVDNGAEDLFAWPNRRAAGRFPKALVRFGKARVVRAIKLRAARLNGTDPSSIQGMLAKGASHVSAI